MRRFVVLSVLFVLAELSSVLAPVVAAATVLRPPVEAPVVDPFRLPDGAFGAGNRGIEYGTEPGDEVLAAADGLVVFAGPVGGSTWVTVDHGDGLKTSYGALGTLAVGRGEVVRRGARVGTTADRLHFSARIDDSYVDPAGLFGELVVEVRLVPHDTDDDDALAAAAERAERLALYDLVQARSGRGGLVSAIGRWVSGVAAGTMPHELLAGLVHTLDIALALGRGLDPDAIAAELVGGLVAVLDPEPCSGAAAAVAAAPSRGSRRRIAVVVDGLGSSSDAMGFGDDVGFDRFGYDADDVVRFSYAGGLTADSGSEWAGSVPRTAYDAEATGRPVEQSVGALVQTLRQVRAANPDAEIDLYGHSLGGVLARLASAEAEADVDLAVVMTFASPHGGAPIATINDALFSTTPGMVVGEGLDAFDPDSTLRLPSVTDLSEAGFVGDRAATAFPDGVHAVTVGHRADVIVPGTEADAPGARHVIVGGFDPRGAHGAIGTLPEVHDEIRLALAGLPPACQGPADAIFDLVSGVTVATLERGAAAAVVAADVRTGGVAGPAR